MVHETISDKLPFAITITNDFGITVSLETSYHSPVRNDTIEITVLGYFKGMKASSLTWENLSIAILF